MLKDAIDLSTLHRVLVIKLRHTRRRTADLAGFQRAEEPRAASGNRRTGISGHGRNAEPPSRHQPAAHHRPEMEICRSFYSG